MKSRIFSLTGMSTVEAGEPAPLLDHDGRVLDRVIGFVQPTDFRQRLSIAREDG